METTPNPTAPANPVTQVSESAPAPTPDKRSRVIIRNLVFDVNERMLRNLCEPIGNVIDVNLPLDPSTGRPRGFAFIHFASKAQSEKAVATLSNTNYKGRTIVVQHSVDQRIYDPQRRPTFFPPVAPQAGQANGGPQKSVERKANPGPQKSVEKPTKSAPQKSVEKQTKPGPQKSVEKEQKIGMSKEERRADELKRTIFVQNVPFDATEESLRIHFGAVGPIAYAKLVQPDLSLPHKGTAFVLFKRHDHAKSLLDIVAQVEKDPTQRGLFDPSSFTTINGRALIIKSAVSRETLSEQEQQLGKLPPLQKAIAMDKKSKRNLNLLNRGKPVLDDNQYGLDQRDGERRKRYFDELVAKVNNPNIRVSQTRILLDHINKSLEESDLKNIVNQILERVLTPEQFKKQKKIKQLVLLKDENKKHKGIAFVEFHEAEVALAFMSEIEKNSNAVDALRQGKYDPIIQFALFDFQEFEKKRKAHSLGLSNQEKNHKTKKEREVLKVKVTDVKVTARNLVEKALKTKSQTDYDKAMESLKKIVARGFKQRWMTKLKSEFNAPSQPSQQKPAQEPQEKLQGVLKKIKKTKVPKKND